MGHPQPPTPVQTNKLTADGIINSQVQPKHTKSMDMWFHWQHNQGSNQKQFQFCWRPGTLQQGDYWTKHHPPSHYRQIRGEILTLVMDFRAKMEKMKNPHT
jgi:hypothetical protein